jgi:hypothetical protein
MARDADTKQADQPGAGRDIEANNAATSGRPDEPVEECPNSRSAKGDAKRAAAKATGVMSASHKTSLAEEIEPTPELDGRRPRSRAQAGRSSEQGSDKVATDPPETETVRITRSNAEIAEGSTSTAFKSPAPRSARTEGSAASAKLGGKPTTTATTPGRMPRGRVAQSSTGDAKPPKRSAKGGHSTGALKSKGADQGHSE